MQKHKTGPQQLRGDLVIVSEADSARIKRLIIRLGSIKAATAALRVGDATFQAARDQGRMMRATRTNLLAQLDRAEAAS